MFSMRGSRPTEFKPISKVRYDSNLEIYFINIEQRPRFYDFENTTGIIAGFMTGFEQNFIPKNSRKNLYKCFFTLVNLQPHPVQNTAEIQD